MKTHSHFCDRCHESGSDKFAYEYEVNSKKFLCKKCLWGDIFEFRFGNYLKEMEDAIVKYLTELEDGYGSRKWAISRDTGIPEDILTVLLKRLKDKKIVEIIRIFSEETLLADGSGYCLDFNYRKSLKNKTQ